jgi:hypothetical protein
VGQVDIVDGRLDLNIAVKPNVPTDRPLMSADLAGGETVSLRGSWQEPVVGGGQQSGVVGDPPN